eukprot:jgi/Mesen1/6670/ME000342S05759
MASATAASSLASALVSKTSLAAFSSSKSSANGTVVSLPQKVSVKSVNLTCRAQKVEEEAVSRRAAITLLAGAAALTVKVNAAEAAYGEAANVFGAVKKQTGFITVNGSGFTIDIPSKWNPSKEVEYPGTVVRYEDNFDAVNNLSVVIQPAKKGSITDYGTPEQFLEEFSYLLGKQAYSGKTTSEGGFAANSVVTASVLEASAPVINGKTYYKLSVLTRTADGDEGGKHQLITGTVEDGKLYILKIQAGDKRWFKGAKRLAEGTDKSFQVV